MKAVICTKYGPPEVLQIKEVEKPVPKDNEVLIKVHAASVNYGDLIARNFKDVTPSKFNMPMPLWVISKLVFGLREPRITVLGSEFSGEIESAGANVKKFKKGDKVFGYLGAGMGAYSEYICLSEKGCLAIKPENISHEEAAVISYGAVMALPLLGKVNLKPGQKVLINGASGGIGSAAVQIAKHSGAEVTGVCGTQRLEFVKALGADKVIDYTKEDFTKNGEKYDVIFDILGKSSFSQNRNSLTDNGIYLLASFKTKQLFQMLMTSISGGKKVICAIAPGSTEDLAAAKKLIEEGKIKTVIDKSFSLEQTAQAHRYAEDGGRKGTVVITVFC